MSMTVVWLLTLIVPSVFDPAVAPAVAAAVRSVGARTDGSKPTVDEL